MSKDSILIVEDDDDIVELLAFNLQSAGFATETAKDGYDALAKARRSPPAGIILDLMLPGLDGFEVCKELKRDPKTAAAPIIMLTARGEEVDRIVGLELGADDYVVKPFEPKELVARIKAVIRRYQGGEAPDKELVFPGLTVNISQYAVTFQGHPLDMPPKELELLYFLASRPGAVFTREQLLNQVWGYDYFGDSRTVDVHVKRLREKLTGGEQYGWAIKTVWGVGYKFDVNARPSS